VRVSTIQDRAKYGWDSTGDDVMCYRVLGRGEDCIVEMLRAVKVGFSGAHASDVQLCAGMLANGLEFKTGADGVNSMRAREGIAGAVDSFVV
jgi:hypothetical protein